MSTKGNKLKAQKENNGNSASRKEKAKNKSGVLERFRNEKLFRISGIFLLLTSVFLIVSFISYFFTWKADFDKVAGSWWSLLVNSEIKTENLLGKLGAIASHQFMMGWFGIASFAFPFLFFLFGFKILSGKFLFPVKKSIGYSFFALLFVSTLSGYLFSKSQWLFLGGSFGFEMNSWLSGLIGKIGTGLLLFFVLSAFLISAFDIKWASFIPVKDDSDSSEPELIQNEEPELADVDIIRNNETSKSELNPELEISEPLISAPISIENNEMDETETPPENEDSISEEFIPVLNTQAEPEKAISPAELLVEIPQGDDLPGELSPQDPSMLKGSDDHQGADTSNFDEDLLEKLGAYDPTLDLSSYQYPPIDLLEMHGAKNAQSREELMAELEANKNRIVETLGHYNIGIDKIKATVGPTVTLFEIVPQAGIRISKIKNLEDDIALSLSALGIRIIAPIPGKGTIGIEVPNQNPETVSMRTMLASEKFAHSEYDLPVALGKTISNEVFVADLTRMPHMLMAGATGQGKSVGLNAVLASLLYKKHPAQVKFVLVDPKKVELSLFKTIERHFLAKLTGEEEAIITDTRKVVNTLNSLCIEMDQRYELLKNAQVRNIKEYNIKFVSRKLNPENGHRFLPYIVLVVDEFADLIMTAGKEIETPLTRLAQLARAIGIHLIIATQRPSVNIITGTIKANFPARIAFRVTSKIDSRTILDTGGADQLIGRGDMLLSTGADLIRLQCAYVDTSEVEKITGYIGNQRGYPDAHLLPEYVGENEGGSSDVMDASDRDPLFEEAARMVVQHQQGSASLLQRRLKLGYNRAGRLIDQLESAGIIGPFEGSKAREVKVKDMLSLEQNYFSPAP